MSYVLDQTFLPEKYFEEICQYPHGTYHEKPLSDHLVEFAKEHELDYRQYDNFNVIIYKKASPGYEDHKPLILQAHMDMVCEKAADSDHDFENDPIRIRVEGSLVRADKTTLGADDGLGVAYMLTILADDHLEHPPLECVFTVQEEVGCNGARDLDFSALSAKRMLSLDNLSVNESSVASSGAQRVTIRRHYEMAEAAACYSLKISGLLGGHSAHYISEERANAIKLLARFLYRISKDHKITLAAISGGNKDNAIPVYAEALFACDIDLINLKKAIEPLIKEIKEELIYSDPDLEVSLSEADRHPLLKQSDSDQLLHFLVILPNGFRHRSMKIEKLTTASENLASIRFNEGDLQLRYFQRAALPSYLDEMSDELSCLCEDYGFEYLTEGRAPGWNYVENSPLRNLLFETYQQITGEQMVERASHGGLETAYFSQGLPGIDIACFGAGCENYHTYRETLDLISFRKNYQVLLEVLKKL